MKLNPTTISIPMPTADDVLLATLNTVYIVAGIVAVIVIIIAGYMYTTSQGDSGAIEKAKNAILYAVIGLVIMLLAFAITNFVIGKVVI